MSATTIQDDGEAVFKRPDAEISDEVLGSGYPLLLFAAGGLRSQLAF